MTCPICESTASEYSTIKVLAKYNVQYFRCNTCQHMFTETPYWLDEAYNSAITQLDIGLVERNLVMAPVVQAVVNTWYNSDASFIDYGGGYGMLVRMLRDRGFDFYRYDIHCANLFADSFDVEDKPPFKAELLTAFEVFEHLIDPVAEMQKMLSLSDTILFSTIVQPKPDITPDSWWYFTPETGQHISLYSRASLQVLADKFNLNYYWNDKHIHMFSRKKINHSLFKVISHPRIARIYNSIGKKNHTLLNKDYAFIKAKIKSYITQ
ncbi:hypothetical protein GCM10027577_23160 [Spirosoma fluminis]